ncbi:sulfotransferase 4A1 [Harpegnathos saltator]|uniref:Sulfotransferase 4A1 n=1 Tax=Harpegnathos saltator TaxID=610380 RepID=E2B771_HARSA|nr:sulfotransferase 4A1 [Harpegnathos saltator]EFN88432.1 Sulfotransferase 4A1 [Harpegnathos saltator]
MSSNNLKIKVFSDEKTTEVLKYYPLYTRGLVAVGEKEWCFPYNFTTFGEELYNFDPRPDDTWIVTYPRSGTTLTQELVWLVANNMNFDEAGRKSLPDRFPFIEILAIIENKEDARKIINNEKRAENSINFVREQLSPRFIKTHLALELLPKIVNSDCKIIYVARNPKDVVVSWYYFQKANEATKFKGNFEQFCDFFMNNRMLYSPYWEHVKEGWAKRHRPNTLFIFYEDLIKDLPGSIRKIAAFYGKSYGDEQIAKLVDHLNINKFRENKMVNTLQRGISAKPHAFIRRGIVGGWKDDFTPEIETRFNKWIVDNMKDIDLVFPC